MKRQLLLFFLLFSVFTTGCATVAEALTPVVSAVAGAQVLETAAVDDEPDSASGAIIVLARAVPEVADYLATANDWEAEAWPSDDNPDHWEVLFASETAGYGWLLFDPQTKTVLDYETGALDAESADTVAPDQDEDSFEEPDESEMAEDAPSMAPSMSAGNSMAQSMAGDDVEDAMVDFDISEDDYDASVAAVSQIAAQDAAIAEVLANNPNWIVDGWPESDDWQGVWNIVFFSENWETELAWAQVDMTAQRVEETEIPIVLAPDVYERQRQAVEALVLADAEVKALGIDPASWTIETDYNGFEQLWEVVIYQGTVGYSAGIYHGQQEIELYWLDAIDVASHTGEMAIDQKAIEIAWEDETLWSKLEGIDNWTTLVTPQSASVYAVEFVAEDQALAFVLVDVASETVLSSE